MAPFHEKLGLIKQFVKILDQNSESFEYLKRFCSNYLKLKLKEVFNYGHHNKVFQQTFPIVQIHRSL